MQQKRNKKQTRANHTIKKIFPTNRKHVNKTKPVCKPLPKSEIASGKYAKCSDHSNIEIQLYNARKKKQEANTCKAHNQKNNFNKQKSIRTKPNQK